MNIIAEDENRICIDLTKEDMSELDITYEELDYSNVETRRVIWTLLDKARQKLGRNIYLTQKMIIEAFPGNKGGCFIIFTLMQNDNGTKRRLVKINETKIICQSDNIDNMIESAKILYDDKKVPKSELYTNGSVYRLIIYPKAPPSAKMTATICEFCDIVSDTAVPYTIEHWKKIASPDAIGILSAIN